MATTLVNKRDSVLDISKLIAALLVVLGHSIIQFVSQGLESPLMNFIWLIQMPLFMVVSGILAPNPNKVSNTKAYFFRVLKMFLTLLFPCLTFLLAKLMYSNGPIAEIAKNAFLYPETNLWFLWVLFFIELFFSFGILVSNKIKNNILKFLTPLFVSLFSILIFVGSSYLFNFDINLFGMKLFCYYMPFYCLGYVFKQIKNTDYYLKNKNYKYFEFISFILSLGIVLFYVFYFKSIMNFDDSNMLFVSIRILGSVISVIFMLILCKYAVNLDFFKKISWAGKFSLECYYLHIIFLQLFSFKLSDASMSTQWIVGFMCFSFLIILVAISLCIIYFVPFLHLILFGKSYSFYKFEKNLFDRKKYSIQKDNNNDIKINI